MGFFSPAAITHTLPKIVNHLDQGDEVLIFRAPDSGPISILPQTDNQLRKVLVRKFSDRPLYWENIVLVTPTHMYDLTISAPRDEVISTVIAALVGIRSGAPGHGMFHWETFECFRNRLPTCGLDVQAYLDLVCLGCDLQRITAAPLEQLSGYGFEIVSRTYDAILDWVEVLDQSPIALKHDHLQLSYGKILKTTDEHYILIINFPGGV